MRSSGGRADSRGAVCMMDPKRTRTRALALCAGVIVCLAASRAARADQILQVFDFATTAAARQAWQAGSGASPVGLFPGIPGPAGESSGTRFPCNFSEVETRCVWDRTISADLSNDDVIELRAYIADPSPVSWFTLYFRSGSGWYGSSRSFQSGWQTLRWSKAEFTVEGAPAGWNRIDGVRVSPWKNLSRDTELVLTRLRAFNPPIAIVRGTRSSSPSTADSTTELMSRILGDCSLDFGIVTDEDVDAGKLAGARLAILPFNDNLPAAEVAALGDFVTSGGKLIVFYPLPAAIGTRLGVQVTGWTQLSLGGMEFVPGVIDCEPTSTTQASWNIMVAHATSPNTRVLAWWRDSAGQVLNRPAWFVGESGAYMTHILLNDDYEKKKRLMLALITHFLPDLREEMAGDVIRELGRIGPYTQFDEAIAGIRAEGAATPRGVRVDRELDAAAALYDSLASSPTSATLCLSLDLADGIRSHLTDAYCLAQTPEVPEFRAVWNHSGTGPFPGDWEKAAANLSDNGFNAVLPNMLWAGEAHYNSALLPHSAEFVQYGDQITACVDACHRHGIQVHVWKVNWNLATAPQSLIDTLRAAGRTQVDVNGDPVDWLCPSNPLNTQLEIDTMLEVAESYDVDGIHFDYIRYPDNNSCYCDPCRARFEADTGLTVANWPTDCFSGSLYESYRAWRCDQITRVVRGVHEAVKAARPNVRISAAVFPDYPSCKNYIGQDWVKWVEEGYLDFVCPMDYTDSVSTLRGRLESQQGAVGGRMPLYPGIGVSLSPRLTADQTILQLKAAREYETGGYVLFNYDVQMAEKDLPALRKGFTAEPSFPSVFVLR